ncbi:MAG: hypothetical protein OEU36_05495 [Gammaproteobacteria bacterium]|nr:hypothetical protein [Gammaproteobacteria bacterium]
MKSPFEVDVQKTADAYSQLHANWERHLDQIGKVFSASPPDLVLTNVGYADLAATARHGIPSITMSCLNWADLYHHYCAAEPEADLIHSQILSAYNSAQHFLQAVPTMPMENIRERREIGVIADIGINQRSQLNTRFGLCANEKLVLVSLGGMPYEVNIEQWPRDQGIRWIIPTEWQARHPDTIDFDSIGMSFVDVLTSCDVLVGKPGYGSFAAAACNGVPVLYVERPDWPEQPYLIQWLSRTGRCRRVSWEKLKCGDLESDIEALRSDPCPTPPLPEGVDNAVKIISRHLIDRTP